MEAYKREVRGVFSYILKTVDLGLKIFIYISPVCASLSPCPGIAEHIQRTVVADRQFQ